MRTMSIDGSVEVGYKMLRGDVMVTKQSMTEDNRGILLHFAWKRLSTESIDSHPRFYIPRLRTLNDCRLLQEAYSNELLLTSL